MSGFIRNPETAAVEPVSWRCRVGRFNFSRKRFPCGMIYRRLVFKDLMQHTRARCSLPARGAVHPTQDSAVLKKISKFSASSSDATVVELSDHSNVWKQVAKNPRILTKKIKKIKKIKILIGKGNLRWLKTKNLTLNFFRVSQFGCASMSLNAGPNVFQLIWKLETGIQC